MAFPAQVFRVLIASPSDVSEERELAVRTIQEWNDLNAAERQLVLLPLRWETHAAPEYGKRPQEVVNQQVVDHCDLLVGVFWTRVGSPTGVADSGTIEEIERVASLGRPVMLYFSQAKQDPDKLDLEQLARLRTFKQRTFPNALVDHYSGVVEFKDKLSKHLELQLRKLVAEGGSQGESPSEAPPETKIVLHFADADNGADLGTELTISTRFIVVDDYAQIPTYQSTDAVPESPKHPPAPGSIGSALIPVLKSMQKEVNPDYYREETTRLVLGSFFKPLRFWLKNSGAIGARDVFIDLSIQSPSRAIVLVSRGQLPTGQPSKLREGFTFLTPKYPSSPAGYISEASGSWGSSFEVSALQPQRQVSPAATLMVGATESCEVVIAARIFADTLPEPLVQTLKLRLEVDRLLLPPDTIPTLVE